MSMISRYFLLFLLAAGLLCCPAALSLPSLVPAALADDAGDLREVQAAINAADYGKAVGLLKPLADAGNAEALYVLGRLTLDGKGVKKNEQRAALFFRQAAEKGDISAQNAWGTALASGQGVRRNYREAARWFRKAAEQGHVGAQLSLADCYANGWGVPKDPDQAAWWRDKATGEK